MYQKNNWETTFPLDKKRKKDYTEHGGLQTRASAFADDSTADAALDYLYADANKSKTQDFLKNSGFPSAQDRALNKQIYGVSEEQKYVRDLLKNKINGILQPVRPTETDRAFLRGLMGDEDESVGNCKPCAERFAECFSRFAI